jgi:hypothetical protein
VVTPSVEVTARRPSPGRHRPRAGQQAAGSIEPVAVASWPPCCCEPEPALGRLGPQCFLKCSDDRLDQAPRDPVFLPRRGQSRCCRFRNFAWQLPRKAGRLLRGSPLVDVHGDGQSRPSARNSRVRLGVDSSAALLMMMFLLVTVECRSAVSPRPRSRSRSCDRSAAGDPGFWSDARRRRPPGSCRR